MDFTGDDLDTIKSVTYNGKALTFSLSEDKKTLIVRGLSGAGITQAPTPKTFSFEYKDGQKTTVTIDVVNYRVEENASATGAAPTKSQ